MTIQEQIRKQIKESEEETREFLINQVSDNLLLLNALSKKEEIRREVLK